MHVFTYGSLMFPEIWSRVVRGTYGAVPARLAQHARFAVLDETYPGMVAMAGGLVDGVLYRDVGEADLAALDAFEGPDYARRRVEVRTAAGEALAAWTYIYLRTRKLSDSPWLPEAFETRPFIDAYCG